MARYKSFKYGNAKKYGTDTSITTIQWGVIIDWDGDGYFTGENEADRLMDLSVSRGRDSYLKPNGGGLERYRPGVAVLTFSNESGRYDPYNTSSPLYPNVLPGKLVDIRVRDGSGSIRTLIRGKITDIETYRDANNLEVTQITVKDGLQFLNDQTISIGLHGTEVDDLINTYILPETGWPDILFRGWPIYGSSSTHLIQQWAIENQNALEAIHELEDVELGQFIHQRDGFGRFVPSTLTYDSTTTITAAECLRDIAFPAPWEVVRNEVMVKVYPRRYVTVNATVFQLDAPVAIAHGETIVFNCEFTYDNYPTIGQTPTYTILVNTASDGSGTNLTGSCVITEDDNPGYAAEVTIYNGSGSAGYVTTLTIEVVNVSYVRSPTSVKVEDTASQATYGKRTLVIDSPIMHSVAYAKEVATWLLNNLKTPQPWPVIQIENRSDLQFAPYLYVTRIRLQVSSKNIDAYYRIGKIEHQWLRETGQAVRTTFKLEPYFEPFISVAG